MAFQAFIKDSARDPILLPQEKKQKRLTIVFAIVVLATIIIIYFGFFRPASVVEDEFVSDSSGSPLEEMDFDAGFLQGSDFKSLKIYGEWPIEISNQGRSNPFLPF